MDENQPRLLPAPVVALLTSYNKACSLLRLVLPDRKHGCLCDQCIDAIINDLKHKEQTKPMQDKSAIKTIRDEIPEIPSSAAYVLLKVIGITTVLDLELWLQHEDRYQEDRHRDGLRIRDPLTKLPAIGAVTASKIRVALKELAASRIREDL